MLRLSTIAIGLLVCLNVAAPDARSQWLYPGGYGNYGMSKWGQDPGAGYMAGLGSFARGQGAYQLEKAQADAINVDTMAKWNKALRARQLALREDQRREAEKREEAREPASSRSSSRTGRPSTTCSLRSSTSTPPRRRPARAMPPSAPARSRRSLSNGTQKPSASASTS